ncbi:MAG: hypothetical protein AAGK97_13025 [Bacteroidota bacterium]
MRLFFICCLLFFALAVNSQELNIKGVGIIQPALLGEFPETDFQKKYIELELLDERQELTGDCLYRQLNPKGNMETFIILNNGKREKIEYNASGFVWVGYKSHCLQFYGGNNIGYKILLNNKQYWLQINALDAYGFKCIYWTEYFQKTDSKFIVVNYNMNLRTKPSLIAEKITLLKINRYSNNYHQMRMTGSFNGAWAKVEVSFWNDMDHYCSDYKNPIKKSVGWIKYIDDEGFPNLYNIPIPSG